MLPVAQIGHYPLFSGLDDDELARLAPLLTRRVFAQGAYIYYPGNPGQSTYLVESGLIRLFLTDAAGQEFLVNLIAPGEVFGHPLVEDNQLRVLGAAAHRPSVVLGIGRDDLFQMMDLSPQLVHNVYLDLTISARKLLLHIRMLVTLPLNGRLATMLLRLPTQEGNPVCTVEIPFSQETFAGWVGASRGRVNRAMKQLQQMGLIAVDGSRVVLLDRPGLARLTEEQTVEAP